MLRLNIPNPKTLNQYISVVLGEVHTTQLNWVASYEDPSTSGTNSGETNDTTPVTLVSYPVTSTGAPNNGLPRKVTFITISNPDSVAASVTLSINTLTGVNPPVINTVTIFQVNLNPGFSLVYDEDGFQVYDQNGVIQMGDSEKLYYTQVDNSWTPLPQRTILNFFSGILAQDNPSLGATEVSLTDTGVIPGTYGSSYSPVIITVDQQGRITNASTGNNPPTGLGFVGFADTSNIPIFSVSGQPVLPPGGTIDIFLNSQNSNTLLAGPTSGGSSQPTFRKLVNADLPQIPASSILANTFNYQSTPQAINTLPNGIKAVTQVSTDSSALIATDSFVQTVVNNAIAGVNPAVAVKIATTSASDTSSLTYNNGVSGIGATFTGTANTPLTFDGVTLTSLNQRVLVKDDSQSPSGAFNGIYYLTQLQTALLPPILTRALDYDQPSDINNTGAIPVVSGTVNGSTSWLLTSTVNTVGTDPLT